MDEANTHILSASNAKTKLLLDANVLIYAHEAYEATGIHLLNYLDRLQGLVDWFVAGCVAVNLHNGGTYNLLDLSPKALNCDAVDMKMNQFPYIKEDGDLGFVQLNSLAGDDWAQVCLAFNYPELVIVTNDSAMFKSAHAVLRGRAVAFHNFISELSPYWFTEKEWLSLKRWLIENKKPLRYNSSWIIKGQKERRG